MQEATKKEAFEHAKQSVPNEACGLVVIVKGRERYFPCRNLSSSPAVMFLINPDDYEKASSIGEITKIFHSHPYTPAVPSQADLISCERSGLPWVICNPNLGTWVEFAPSGYKAPLIGREWVWGVTDCWALTRDWYVEKGLSIRDWRRPGSPEEFEMNPLFDRLYEETGFSRVDPDEEIKVGDAILMSIQANGLNHCGVYVGDGLILHHVRGRLSSTDMYGGWLQKCTGKVVRHYDWMKLQR